MLKNAAAAATAAAAAAATTTAVVAVVVVEVVVVVVLLHDYLANRGRLKCWVVVVGLLLNVPVTGECILGTALLRQFYVLPH